MEIKLGIGWIKNQAPFYSSQDDQRKPESHRLLNQKDSDNQEKNPKAYIRNRRLIHIHLMYLIRFIFYPPTINSLYKSGCLSNPRITFFFRFHISEYELIHITPAVLHPPVLL